MAGIYFHIPFCKQACHYCNFYFSTNRRQQQSLVTALIKELETQKNFFENGTVVQTIYFGGGTPSLLTIDEVHQIMEAIKKYFVVLPQAEISFECNPDDISFEQCTAWLRAGVNRLSIGIQSFVDAHLQLMNRAHNSKQALQSVENAVAAGFKNISIDLMYALPNLSDAEWKQNILTACSLPINHISCYNLTIEEKTALAKFIATGKCAAIDDEQAARQFQILLDITGANGFEQYEISNFARQQQYSAHNTAYWQSKPYLGIGPSAHSFKNNKRYANIAHTAQYVQAIAEGNLRQEIETLTPAMQYNEWVLTRLRTCWGVDVALLETQFGYEKAQCFKLQMSTAIMLGRVKLYNNCYTLTALGKLWADDVAQSAFIV
ncbi:MAG: radical SAM family heme chaperone HemW [Bacteroidia bacterium]|nr:radical SAM family heme chaperone HemW [Bacteroidia bacterium]HQV00617.1 radical SAM family heme chaperone HemW [Bacteroidia bacterium]